MKKFNRQGECNSAELEELLTELLECVRLANTVSVSEFSNYINIRKLNVNYEQGKYAIMFDYSIDENILEDDKDTDTPREAI